MKLNLHNYNIITELQRLEDKVFNYTIDGKSVNKEEFERYLRKVLGINYEKKNEYNRRNESR